MRVLLVLVLVVLSGCGTTAAIPAKSVTCPICSKPAELKTVLVETAGYRCEDGHIVVTSRVDGRVLVAQ